MLSPTEELVYIYIKLVHFLFYLRCTRANLKYELIVFSSNGLEIRLLLVTYIGTQLCVGRCQTQLVLQADVRICACV